MENVKINSLSDRLSKPCQDGCTLNESDIPFNPYIEEKFISELDNAVVIALPTNKALTLQGSFTIVQLSGTASYSGRIVSVPQDVYSLCYIHHGIVVQKSPPLFISTFSPSVPNPIVAQDSSDSIFKNLVANDIIDSDDAVAIQNLVKAQNDLTILLIVPWTHQKVSGALPFDIHLSFASKVSAEFMHHLEWLTKIKDTVNYKRIVIAGTTNAGKSSLTKLINNYLLNYGKVQILDMDCGQTEFTIPSILGLVDSSEILYSGPYVKFGSGAERKSLQIVFGHTSPKSDPINFEAAVNQLCKHIDNDAYLIANSNGWNSGFGKDVLIETLTMIQPDLLIELNDSGSPVIDDAVETLGEIPFDTMVLPTLQSLDDKSTVSRRNTRGLMISEYFLCNRGIWLASYDSAGVVPTEQAFKTLPKVTVDFSEIPVYSLMASRILECNEATETLPLTMIALERDGFVATPAICTTTHGTKATFVLPMSEQEAPIFDTIKILDVPVPSSVFVGKSSATPFYYNYGSLTNLNSGSKPLSGRSSIVRK